MSFFHRAAKQAVNAAGANTGMAIAGVERIPGTLERSDFPQVNEATQSSNERFVLDGTPAVVAEVAIEPVRVDTPSQEAISAEPQRI